jgi:hypothetical protein
MFAVNRNPSPKDLRMFAWSMLIGFHALALISILLACWKSGWTQPFFWPGERVKTVAIVFSAVGASMCLVSLTAPSPAKRLYVGWMTVMVPIGVAMSTVMLTLLFVALLPLFSIIVRLGDPLRKKFGGASYWENYRHYEPTLERMRRPF